MVAGPLDRRRQRFRCIECASSHLKCSGRSPCDRCVRLRRWCILPLRNVTIAIDTEGQHDGKMNQVRNINHLLLMHPTLDNQSLYVGSFFQIFLPQNNFSGKPSSYWLSTQGHLACHPTIFHAVSAIGALQLSRSRECRTPQHVKDALCSYQAALIALKADIIGALAQRQEWLSMLWCTFLLGLFELMYDNTGDGWLSHMLYGTSRVLQCLTPDGCLHGPGREFFLEIRVFEIARAMLFTQKTFLSTKPWQSVTDAAWADNYVRDWSPKEQLLDIMTLTADLCYRVSVFTRSKDGYQMLYHDIEALNSFANEGIQLRSALQAWTISAGNWNAPSSTDHQMTIAWTFFSAISIYLSGIFDYSILWQQQGIPIPSLTPNEIQQHVNTILELTLQTQHGSNLTGLLFLFPLRIAGARATALSQRTRINALLANISLNFAAARAFTADLEQLWADPLAKCNTSLKMWS